ncbi:MAG: adenylate kinase [Gemmatimonadota bacterium]
MVVVLLGPPGVGKGTQAIRLADRFGWEHISTGDLLRAARRDGTELGRKAQSFMDAGELVPDSLILDLVREHLRGVAPQAGILFDGFPRTTPQAEGLEKVLAENGRRVDRVVLFQAPEEVLVKRLSGRRSCPECGAVYNIYFNPPRRDEVCDRCGTPLVQRPDDEADTVRRRLQVYEELTAPLIEWYREHGTDLVTLEADRPVDEVQEDFRRAVGL